MSGLSVDNGATRSSILKVGCDGYTEFLETSEVVFIVGS